MKELTKAMCWETVTINRDTVNGVGIAVYKKPTTNECYEQRSKNEPPTCPVTDDPNAAWYCYVKLNVIMALRNHDYSLLGLH